MVLVNSFPQETTNAKEATGSSGNCGSTSGAELAQLSYFAKNNCKLYVAITDCSSSLRQAS
jgi:hypothetical protein